MADSTTKRTPAKRKPAAKTSEETTPAKTSVPATVKTTWTGDEREALVSTAWYGDTKEAKAAMPELRRMLDATPDAVKALANFILTPVPARVRVGYAEPNRPLFAEVLERRLKQMQGELEGEHPSTLERLLCRQIAVSWLTLETLQAKQIAGDDGKPAAPDALEYHDRMISRATKRHLEAVVSLAKVRRLLRPVAAQVNIAANGGQQVNIAGAAASLPEGIALPTITEQP